MKEENKSPFRLSSLHGKLARLERITAAENAAREALAGARRAMRELIHRCGDLEEARARLSEAEAAVAGVRDDAQRKRLEERLANVRKVIEESENLCKEGAPKR